MTESRRTTAWLASLLCSEIVLLTACTKEPCGNGVIDPGEMCDDGNNEPGDGCRADCLGTELCGDGLLDPCEECDDGEQTAECDADCTLPECGDGVYNPLFGDYCIIIDARGAVDVTLLGDGDCDCPCSDCCGNGQVDHGVAPLEQCDDELNTETCDADCTFAECGDGYENPAAGEECDWGAGGQCGVAVSEGTEGNRDDVPDTCRTNCRKPYCGDGVVDTGSFPGGGVIPEECDGGGQTTPSCDADCTRPSCGDGITNEQAGEVCDSGGIDTADCDSDCTEAACGDGHLNQVAGEQCETHDDCPPSYRCRVDRELDTCNCTL